jgi:DNA-binding CsgD family transcriptional regulator
MVNITTAAASHQAWLRALLKAIDTPVETGQPEQILLDANVDGHRYMLVRMPATVRATPPLSRREIEIVRLVAAGHPNKVIAGRLDISTWTVCTHLRRIFAKLDVKSRAGMVGRLAEYGLNVEAQTPAKQSRPVAADPLPALRPAA